MGISGAMGDSHPKVIKYVRYYLHTVSLCFICYVRYLLNISADVRDQFTSTVAH